MDHILKMPSEGFIRGPVVWTLFVHIRNDRLWGSLRLKIGKMTMLNFSWE